jgi:hypothetical protein
MIETLASDDPNRILNFGHCDLPFDVAQGGELVEPFDICDLLIILLSVCCCSKEFFDASEQDF